MGSPAVTFRKAAVWLLVIGLLFWTLFPVWWIITTSLKSRVEAFQIPPSIVFIPTLENYVYALLYNPRFLSNYLNSMIIATGSTLISLVLGVPAAYAFARYSFKRKNDLNFWILTTRMAPRIGVIVPFFLIWRFLNLLDTHAALIITYLVFNLSFVIWIMQSFFVEMPYEIEEAAMIDGCTTFQVFSRISLPANMPGLAATAIFCVIQSWNEFLFALILTGKTAETLPPTTLSFIAHGGISWGPLTAAALMTALPVMIFTLLIQKHLVRAFTFGIIKG